MHIGYLGAGFMATPMIENLLSDGHEVSVWNRTAAKAEALTPHGAHVVAEAAHVCESGGVVLSCLADDRALDAVFVDEYDIGILRWAPREEPRRTGRGVCRRPDLRPSRRRQGAHGIFLDLRR